MSEAVPAISIVITVKDDAVRLKSCLEALGRQTVGAGAFEAIVVDNGSTDRPERTAALFPFVRLAREEKIGVSAGRNKGLSLVRGGIVAFTDADCLPEPDWLERGRAALAVPGADMVAGRVEVFPRNPGRPSALELFDMAHAFDQKLFVERWHFGATANVLMRRAVVEAVGGFDETIPNYGEDLDLGQRIWKAGFSIRYVPEAVVRHPARFEPAVFRNRIERTMRAAYRAAAPDARRLLLDVWYDWPSWREVARGLAHPVAARPRDRLKLALATAWVKGWRTKSRFSIFWEQRRTPRQVAP